MQMKSKFYRSLSGSTLVAAAAVLLLWLPVSTSALAQSAEVSAPTSMAAPVIPQQVRYTGAMAGRAGVTVEAVFKIYTTAEGGEALWTETQQVAVGADGTYTVLLGSASQGGLPQTVFAAGQARWVGVTIGRSEELTRSPLSSVAYAMKAGDAESVGGLSAANLATKDDLAKMSQTVATAAAAQPQFQVQPETSPTGSGTADYVPLWTASGTLGNSGIFQAASGDIGIGTTTPGGPLELATGATGGANATMMLKQTSAASGNYYADIGLYNSTGLIGNLSALGAGYPAGQLFGANDVVFLGGQQNAATNLIMLTNTKGAIKFGTGGFAKTNERLRISATGGVSIGNSYVATDPGAGNLIVSGKVGIGATAPGATLEVGGTAKFDGLITFDTGQTFPGTGTITGVTATSPLTGGGTSGALTLGLNTSTLEATEETTYDSRYALLSGGNTFNSYIEASNSGTGQFGVEGFGGNGASGVYGGSQTRYGVEGGSNSGTGVVGLTGTTAAGFDGVLGYTGTAYSTSYSNEADLVAAGVWGDTSAPLNSKSKFVGVGVVGTTDAGYAGLFVNDSAGVPALAVGNGAGTGAEINAGTAGDGLDASATSGSGVYGLTEAGNGVFGETQSGGNGVFGVTDNPTNFEAGVAGFAVSQSNTGQLVNLYSGVWGDTGTDSDTLPSGDYAVGLLGTTDNSTAGEFLNKSSDYATLFVHNYGTGGIGTAGTGKPGLFNTLMASSANGTCGIDDGSMSCTGALKSLTSTGGSRTVETYAMQSPENWMEDFGSGELVNGHAIISVDPAFAGTVSGDASYHVFITPNGDSKGLYVTAKTASGFEVRESGGGTSSLSFDYRIVAKRAGYEGQRMVDVTEAFARETARANRRLAQPVKPAVRVKRQPSVLLEQALKTPRHTVVPSPVPTKRVPQAPAAPAQPAASK